ncbi:MAG: peptidylprolyl isomerase [Halioglobus sp.]
MRFLTILFALLSYSWSVAADQEQQPVVSEDGVEITYDELQFMLSKTDRDMRQSAANDLGTRFEILNIFMVNKKMARDAERMSPESAGDRYWDMQLQIRALQRKIALDNYLATQKQPDVAALAQERYKTQKDKYALVPERRLTSHILLACEKGCDGEERRREMEAILTKLGDGEDFAELARRYSDDPGSKNKGGRLDTWIDPSAKGRLVKQYLDAAFKLTEEGELSNIVTSRYGFHIIRLDKLEPPSHLPLEQVRPRIERAIESEWRELALKEYQASLKLGENVVIDGKAMEELFAPYKLPALQK